METVKTSRNDSVEEGISKLTDEQKGQFKELVLDCLVKRYSEEESRIHIKDKLGIDIVVRDFNRVRGDLKRELGKNLRHLQRDRSAYGREYFKRIEEIRMIQKKLWKLIDENPDRPLLQKGCLSELYQSTITLGNLYESLRNLNQRDYGSDLETEEISTAPSMEPSQAAPEVEAPQAKRIVRYTSDGKPIRD